MALNIEKSASVSAELSGAIPFVWGKIAALAAEKWNRRGLLAAYLFELERDIEIIDSLNLEGLKSVSVSDRAFRGFVECLRTEVAVSILFAQDRRNYKRFLALLKKRCKAEDGFAPEAEQDGSPDDAEAVGTVLNAMSFSVRKIEVLRSLAAFADGESALFPDYRLAVRLRNIRKSLALIRNCARRMAKAES